MPSVFSPPGFSTITPIHSCIGDGGGGGASSAKRSRGLIALADDDVMGGKSRMYRARRQCEIAIVHRLLARKKISAKSITHSTVIPVLAMTDPPSTTHPRPPAATPPGAPLLPVSRSNGTPRRRPTSAPARRASPFLTKMGSILDSTRGQSREARSRRRNYVRGLSELNAFMSRLENDAHAWVSKLPDSPSAPTGNCVVCMDPLRADAACGCDARCDAVKRLVCCNQDLHYTCLDDFVLRQLSSDLFLDTMDEMLAWMTLGKDVIKPETVLLELSFHRNFMCCPLCRSSFLLPAPKQT